MRISINREIFAVGGRVKKVSIISLALLVACDAPVDNSSLDNFGSTWSQAYEAGDFASMRNLYEADARLMTRHQPAKVGVDEILSYFENSRKSGAKAEITFEYEEEIIDGDYAFKISKWWLESPQAVGEPARDSGRSLVIFKRGNDGIWRLWRDIDNHTPDVTFDTKPENRK